MKYVSDKPTWFEPTDLISSLDDTRIQLHYANGALCPSTLHVDSAHPEGRDAGKCSVAFHFYDFSQFPVGDEAADNAQAIAVSHPYIEYLTQDGLEIVLNFVRTRPEGASLDLPPDWEYSDR